jgi:hypothetical protein
MRPFMRWIQSRWSKKEASSRSASQADFQSTPTCDLVGFLPELITLHFKGGRLEPTQNYDDTCAYVKEITNVDHFVYPPIVHKVITTSLDLKNAKWNEVPKTRRQAHLHRLPPSHFLYLDQPPASGDMRTADGAFLIHLIGYVFGYRMQFHDWWIDGRVSMRSAHAAIVTPQAASSFIGHAYSKCCGWPFATQKRFTNALYMMGRGPLYEWDWELFTIYYMVFDALYRTAQELHGVNARTHPERLSVMCAYYGLFSDQSLFDEIARLRRELFHEALWSGAMPGTDPIGETWNRVSDLRRICERLIPAMVDYKTPYVASPWNHFGQFMFDPS